MNRSPMSDQLDETLEAWDQFVTAVRHLARSARPGLTIDQATTEALSGWVSEQAALTNADQPFTNTDNRRRW
jgi:hypothetical protein